MRISCITSKVNKCKNKRMKNSTSLVGDQDHKVYCRPTRLKYVTFVTENYWFNVDLITVNKFEKEIKKNLKQYTAKYDVVDIARNKIVSQELLEKRRKMMDEFTAFRRNAARRQNEHRQRRLELRNGQDTDKLNQEVEEIEYTVQLLVETKKEEVNE